MKAPNKDACSRKFFENLQRVLSEFGITNEDNVIIGGDFNCPLSRNDLPVQPLIQCEAGRAKTKLFVPLGLKMVAK